MDLKALSHTKNIGLRALLKVQEIGMISRVTARTYWIYPGTVHLMQQGV